MIIIVKGVFKQTNAQVCIFWSLMDFNIQNSENLKDLLSTGPVLVDFGFIA